MLVRRSLLAILMVALATAATAVAQPSASGIELARGSGRAVLALQGAVLGALEHGRVTVRILSDQTRWKVDGHEWSQRLASGAIVYGGEEIRFRLFRGRWRLVVDGTGIDASAVGRGTVTLRGMGTYVLGGGAPKPWPKAPKTFRLGASRIVSEVAG